jgi:hypothetical protein
VPRPSRPCGTGRCHNQAPPEAALAAGLLSRTVGTAVAQAPSSSLLVSPYAPAARRSIHRAARHTANCGGQVAAIKMAPLRDGAGPGVAGATSPPTREAPGSALDGLYRLLASE